MIGRELHVSDTVFRTLISRGDCISLTTMVHRK